MQELLLGGLSIPREGVLGGTEAVGGRIEILDWFAGRVNSERIEAFWG